MNTLLLEIEILLFVLVVGVIVYVVFPHVRGTHFTSRLSCPKCGKQFDYDWVPGGSFSSVHLGTKRYIRCPNCHEWSTFEIWATRIKKNQQ